MKITRVDESKISWIDFENLVFGRHFTDHMFVCHYENSAWQTPEIMPYQPLLLEPSTSVFHYGQAVFEGMKARKDTQGKIWLFRPEKNFKRINISSKRLQIPEFPEPYFFEGLSELLKLDREWIKQGAESALYIRPFVFASQPSVQAAASNRYTFMIICAPVKSYYAGEVNVLIAEKYSRAADGGVGFAKAAGNYAAQFLPTAEALKQGCQQIIWTDANTHQYLEEAGTMNIFFKIGDGLVTAPISDRILDGITRKSIIALARRDGIAVEERPITVTELREAWEAKSLKEIFGTGSAVGVLPIKSFSYKQQYYELPAENETALQLKQQLVKIQRNDAEDPFNWLYEVC